MISFFSPNSCLLVYCSVAVVGPPESLLEKGVSGGKKNRLKQLVFSCFSVGNFWTQLTFKAAFFFFLERIPGISRGFPPGNLQPQFLSYRLYHLQFGIYDSDSQFLCFQEFFDLLVPLSRKFFLDKVLFMMISYSLHL